MQFEIPILGSYDDVIYAVRLVKGIMRSDGFNTLLFISIGLSMVIGVYNNLLSGIFRGGVKSFLPVGWALGLFLYAIAIRNTADLYIINENITDIKKNQFVVIKDVPLAPALYLWLYGTTIKSFNNLVNTYGSPILDNDHIKSDISYKLFTEISSLYEIANKTDPILVANLKQYMDDCLMVGTSMGHVSVTALQNPGTETVWDLMKFNGNVFIMPYRQNNGNTVTKTCISSHELIKQRYDLVRPKIMKEYCTQFGYDEHYCRDVIESLSVKLLNRSEKDFILDYIASKAALSVVNKYLKRADNQVNINNISASIMAEKWLPAITSTMFVIVLLFTPIVFLLIFFSPGGVLKYYVGMAVWLILWGMSDRILFVKYQYDLYELFKNIRLTGLGINDLLTMSSSVMENVALYGKMRWTTATLSLGMSMGILKIGNHALANMAQDIGSTVLSASGGVATSFSGFSGVQGARDAMLREEARGEAIGVTTDEAIVNQVTHDYDRSIANTSALRDAFGRDSGGIVGRNEAVGTMISQKSNEYSASLYGGGLNEYIDIAAHTNATNEYIKATELGNMVEAFGGVENTAKRLSDNNLFNTHNQLAYMDQMKRLYGDDYQTVSDIISGVQSVNFQTNAGEVATIQEHAKALDMGITDYASFVKNNFMVDSDNIEKLSRATRQDLEVGQRLSFSIADGNVTNLQAYKQVDKVVNGHHITGEETIVFGENGESVTYYKGNIDGYEGTLSVDSSGNSIHFNGDNGVSLRTSSGVQINIANSVLDKALRGDAEALAQMGLFGENSQLVISMLAEHAQRYFSQHNQFDLSAGAEASVGGNFKVFSAKAYAKTSIGKNKTVNSIQEAFADAYESIRREHPNESEEFILGEMAKFNKEYFTSMTSILPTIDKSNYIKSSSEKIAESNETVTKELKIIPGTNFGQ